MAGLLLEVLQYILEYKPGKSRESALLFGGSKRLTANYVQCSGEILEHCTRDFSCPPSFPGLTEKQSSHHLIVWKAGSIFVY